MRENHPYMFDRREHARMRPGMYLGRTDEEGLYERVWRVINEAVEEVLDGHGDHIWITLRPSNEITVRDNGRGIPVYIVEETGKRLLEMAMTNVGLSKAIRRNGNYELYTGSFNSGLSAVNALCSTCTVEIATDGYLWRQEYREGIAQSDVIQVRPLGEHEGTGTSMTFRPDFSVLEPNDIQYDLIAERARDTAYLIPHLTIEVRDESGEKQREERFHFPKGLEALIEDLSEGETKLHKPIIESGEWTIETPNEKARTIKVDFALQYVDAMNLVERSYVNGVRISPEAIHLAGLLSALEAMINHPYFREEDIPFSREEITAGLRIAISITHSQEKFGQHTYGFYSADMLGAVSGIVFDRLKSQFRLHPRLPPTEVERAIIEKCEKNREALRRG